VLKGVPATKIQVFAKKKHLKEYDGQTKAEESRPKKLL